MNTVSRVISGGALVALGLYVGLVSFAERAELWFLGAAVGVFLVGLGVFIFLNKKEDDIEEINK